MKRLPLYSEKNFILFFSPEFSDTTDIYPGAIENLILLTLLKSFPEMISTEEVINRIETIYEISILERETLEKGIELLVEKGDLTRNSDKIQVSLERHDFIYQKYSDEAANEAREIFGLKNRLEKLLSAKLKFKSSESFGIFWKDFYINFILQAAYKILHLYKQVQNISVSEEDYYTELQSFLEDFFSRYSDYKATIQSVIIDFIQDNSTFINIVTRRFYELLVLQNLNRNQNNTIKQMSYTEAQVYIESVLLVILQIMNSVHKVEEIIKTSIKTITGTLIKDTYNKSLLYKNQASIQWKELSNEMNQKLFELKKDVNETSKNLDENLDRVYRQLDEYKKEFDVRIEDTKNKNEEKYNELQHRLLEVDKRIQFLEKGMERKISDVNHRITSSRKAIEEKFIVETRPRIQNIEEEIQKTKRSSRILSIGIFFLGIIATLLCHNLLKNFNYTLLSMLVSILLFVVNYIRNLEELENLQNRKNSMQTKLSNVSRQTRT